MEISEFVWPEDWITHIGRHGVEAEEFEEVCFGKALVLRAKAEGKNPVTAREMTASEKQRSARWKKP